MRIELEQQVTIALPPGFQSAGACIFNSNDQRSEDQETFIADRSHIPVGAHSLDEVMADRLREFEGGLPGKLLSKQGHPIQILGHEGREEELLWELEGVKARTFIAVALVSPSEYIQFTLTAPERAGAAADFHRIAASAVPSGMVPHTAAQKGFIRQFAGPVTLELPATLLPPHAYTFVSSEASTTLIVKIHPGNRSAEPHPDLRQEMARETQHGATIEHEQTSSMARAGGFGPVIRYLVTHNEPAGRSVRAVELAQLTFPDGVVVTLEGRADGSSLQELDALFSALAATLDRAKP